MSYESIRSRAIRSTRLHPFLGLLLAAGVACGDTVDPSSVSLSGHREARPNILGLATVALDLVETNRNLTGAGSYVSNNATLPNGTIEAQGVHLSGQIALTLTFHAGTEVVSQYFNDQVDADVAGAVRVNFDRR